MLRCTLWATAVSFALATLPALAQSPAPATMAFKPAADMKFSSHPALPPCATIAVQDGDPSKGPSVVMLRAEAGCVIPWHWHTPNERLIILSGSAKGEMKDMGALSFKPGDFVVLPSKGVHQFTASTAVELYDISDAAFDIHYVDASGKEIPVDQALKPAQDPPSGSNR